MFPIRDMMCSGEHLLHPAQPFKLNVTMPKGRQSVAHDIGHRS